MRTGLFAFLAVAAMAVPGFASSAEAAGLRHHHGVVHHAKAQHHIHRQVHRHGAWARKHDVGKRLATVAPFGAAVTAGGAGVTVINQAQPAETTLNINTNQTVVGIRRAPESAPLLFIIPDNRRETRAAERASAAIRSLGSSDTTTARIIVVR
jgi:hypothetical protein